MKQKLLLFLMALVVLLPSRLQARDFQYTYEGQTVTYTVIDEDARTCMIPDINNAPENKNISGELILPGHPMDGETSFTLTEIGTMAFFRLSALTSIDIPETVIKIGERAFNYSGLISLDIPDSVTSIGEYICQGCESLKSVRIGNSITVIPQFAFVWCYQLEEVNLPDSLLAIMQGAFQQCYSLKSVVIPNSVKTAFNPFYLCTSLEWISIGESLDMEWIGRNFPVVPNLKEYKITEGNNRYAVKDGVLFDKTFSTLVACPVGLTGEYEIPSSVSDINSYASANTTLSDIRIPNSVEQIGENAFYSADNITSMSIPESVKRIEGWAFRDCSNLNTITIQGSLPELGIGVFANCSRLQNFNFEDENYAYKNGVLFNQDFTKLILAIGTISGDYVVPETVTEIADGAFNSADISSLTVPESVSKIGTYAFEYCDSLISVKLPDSIVEIGDGAFSRCQKLESINIPKSLTTINEELLSSCVSLSSLTIPNSVISIGNGAFCGTDIREIIIPESVVSIGAGAFIYCENLTSIILSENISSIEERTFWQTGLTSLTIPKKVQTIGEYAFNFCRSLTDIIINGEVKEIGSQAFNQCENLGKVYVPSMESWLGITFADETANPLYYGAELIIDNKSTDFVEIPDDSDEVGDYAFAGLKNLVEVIISDAVEKIGGGSFTGTGLENINIPQTVKTIGDKAFQFCTDLKSAIIGKIIGTRTRSDAPAETTSNLSSVGNEAFSGCTNLAEVAIGANVGTIGEKAFEGCGSIKRVDSYSLLAPTAAEDAFDDTTLQDAVLHVPAGYADVYENDPVWSRFSEIVADLDAPESISLDAESITVGIGEKKQIVASYEGTEELTWHSSDPEVAAVDEEGIVSGIKEGTAKITVTSESGARAYCEVKVVPIEAEGIELNMTEAEITEGETVKLTATVKPDNATDKTITWTSSDETVATVAADGTVSALKPGTTTITAKTANDLEATCKITVVSKIIDAEGIELNFTEAEVTEGETVKLTATVKPEDATDKTITWTSSDETVATVAADGTVSALKPGTTIITAKTANDLTANCKITVVAKVIDAEGIELNMTEAEVTEGETVKLTATVKPENATDKTITWTSSDETVATVAADGTVSARKPGTATITAKTANDLEATCKITVVAKVIAAESIALNLTEAKIKEEETVQLTATVLPAEATDKTVTWTSSDAAVATVDANGLVTGVKTGTATITAKTSNGLTATCTITVDKKSGIDGVDDGSQIRVIARDGVIIVEAPEGLEVEVYSIAGLRVAQTREHRIEGLTHGVYIVRVGGKAVKVVL